MTSTYDPYASLHMEVTYGGPDRAVILQNARMKPYNCIVCKGESDGRPFVDFNLDLEWYGSVYMCGYCFVMVANKLGYYSPDQFSKLSDDYKVILESHHRLVADNDKLRSILGSMFNLTPDQRDNFVASFREFEIQQKDAIRSSSTDGEAVESNQRIDKQNVEQRPDGISGSPSGDG